jgi:hypothetical protein
VWLLLATHAGDAQVDKELADGIYFANETRRRETKRAARMQHQQEATDTRQRKRTAVLNAPPETNMPAAKVAKTIDKPVDVELFKKKLKRKTGVVDG